MKQKNVNKEKPLNKFRIVLYWCRLELPTLKQWNIWKFTT